MDLIRWTPDLELGIEEIDRQHREVVDLINRLYACHLAGERRDVLGAIIEELERQTERHFADEERWMADNGIAGAAEHAAEHRSMLDDLHRYCDACVLGDGDPKVILGYMEHGFLRHIDDTDRRLVAGTAPTAA